MAAEASTVGQQHITAIPTVISLVLSGIKSTRYPMSGVTRRMIARPKRKYYDSPKR